MQKESGLNESPSHAETARPLEAMTGDLSRWAVALIGVDRLAGCERIDRNSATSRVFVVLPVEFRLLLPNDGYGAR